MINIVCLLRNGGKVGYSPSWVEKLHNSIKRNVTLPYRFICLSDVDVPCDRIPLEDDGPGFWAKLQLFKSNMFKGPVLYIDLDTVICKNIDDIIKKSEGKEFVMWYETDKKISSSAMMYWEGDYSILWDIYKSRDIEYWRQLYSAPPLYGDQAIVSENIKHKTFLDFCPSDWFHIASKKDDSLNLDNVRMLMFRKVGQKPSTMQNHILVKEHWK